MASRRALVSLLVALLLCASSRAATPPDDRGDVDRLEPGATIEGELEPGAAREWRLKIKRKKAVEVTVAWDGDLTVSLLGPDGEERDRSTTTAPGGGAATMVASGGPHRILLTAGSQAKAVRFTLRAGAARRATRSDLDLVEAGRLALLATRQLEQGDAEAARSTLERELTLRERARGPLDVSLLPPLERVRFLYLSAGRMAQLATNLSRQLAIVEHAFGPGDPRVEDLLLLLATASFLTRDFAACETAATRALALAERRRDPAATAQALRLLAQLMGIRNDLTREEEYRLREVAVLERAPAGHAAALADALYELSTAYQRRAMTGAAVRSLERAVSLLEADPARQRAQQTATALLMLAHLYLEHGDAERARAARARLRALEPSFSGDAPEAVAFRMVIVASDAVLDATLLSRAGDDDAAARALERAAEELQRSGHSHLLVGLLPALARQHMARKDFRAAERVYSRYIVLLRDGRGLFDALAPIGVPSALSDIALAYRGMGEVKRATICQAEAVRLLERDLDRTMVVGSERQKLALLAQFEREPNRALSLHLGSAHASPEACAVALRALLQHKGRALDAATDSVAVLRRRGDPEDLRLLERLADLQSRLAAPAASAPGTAPQADAALERETDDLGAAISGRSAEVRATFRPVSLAEVGDAIPVGAALVEYARYEPADPRDVASPFALASRPRPRRYAAYVLRKGAEPRGVDLGDAAEVDALVAGAREALRDPERADARELARRLDARVMAPVRELVGDATRLLVSPDGALNLIPFGALVDERGRFLVERYEVTFLTSGRDLVRLRERAAAREPALVVADPDYGVATEASPAAGARKLELAGGARHPVFGRLAGTGAEAEALRRLLPAARVLVGPEATEAAVKSVRGPVVLHLATHGFFLTDASGGSGASAASRKLVLGPGGLLETAEAAAEPSGMAALRRSGLALAGANTSGGSGDGILTALEVAGLDLWGTRLVVLSACETGLGAVRDGDGVYGMRRALVLAGSESQLISLWPVSDLATRDLMVAYYAGLVGGAGRAEALRRVQLEMLRAQATSHPFYWAGFIHSGAWAQVPEIVGVMGEGRR